MAGGARSSASNSSAEMLAKAAAENPGIEWQQADLATWRPRSPGRYHLFERRAALARATTQPLFPALFHSLAPGGMLAVQIPRNFGAPSHTLDRRGGARRAVARQAGAAAAAGRRSRAPDFYYDLLAPLAAKPRHLGDRVSAGARRRAPGQGIHQMHLALARCSPRSTSPSAAEFEAAYAELVDAAYPRRARRQDPVPVPPDVFDRHSRLKPTQNAETSDDWSWMTSISAPST